ncbi:zinc finger protein 37-like [Teleopsis dalmanni]|uniref:zinc finger protein 37-like n=1 Tax=Teleopsis dalmanni TaxID=139649 RepID=UPI0018CDB190|nr:zinc finger protein 37-like [Teleopsis dalmanni]
MPGCCLCGNNFKIGFKIFEVRFGQPPVVIHDVVIECIGPSYKVKENKKICKKCYGKIQKYYKAKIEMQSIQMELIDLYKNVETQKDYDSDETDNDIENDIQSYVEVKMDENCSNFNNFSQVMKNEIIDEKYNDFEADLNQFDNKSESECVDRLDIGNPKEMETKEKKSINESLNNKKPTHKPAKKFGSVCDQCGKSFHSYTGFIYHRRTHDPIKHFKCKICGESYRDKYHLKLHMAYHTGETPFECEICSKRFVHKIALNKHKQTHDERHRRFECEQCGLKLRSRYHLVRHMITHTGAKPFPCPVCEKSFTTNYGMKLHLEEHKNPGSTRQQRYRCKKCPRTFTNIKNYEKHCEQNDCIQVTNDNTNEQCYENQVTNKSFSTCYNSKNQTKTMPGCCLCGNDFKIGFKIFEVRFGQPPVVIYDIVIECIGPSYKVKENKKICKKCYGKIQKYYKAKIEMQSIQMELIDLYKNVETQKDYDSDETDNDIENDIQSSVEVKIDENCSIFNNFSQVIKKEIIDEKYNDFEAELDQCDKKSESECIGRLDISNPKEMETKEKKSINESLNNKKPTHKPAKKFGSVCDQCGKSFHSYTGFIYHRRTHDPIKHFKCKICGESYRAKYHLKLHMAYHTGETPFECEICSKRFVHKIALNKHKQTHDEQHRRFECEQCGLKLRSKSHLRRHMITHTGAKPFPCPVCEKSFTTNYGMKLHLEEHKNPGSTRQQRYRCKKCPRTFTNIKNYEKHCKLTECVLKKSDNK